MKVRNIVTGLVLAAAPAFAQLGGVTGAVSGTVSGATRATVAAPGSIAAPGLSPGHAGANQDVFGSLSVAQNAALSNRISGLVPPASSVSSAAAGFQSDSDFITTLHAAHNLNIPFDELKASTTGKSFVSMDSAVRKLRPDLDKNTIKENLALAQRQSERDIAQASAGGKDKVSSRITSNDRLAARLNPLVPSGETLGEAAAGFKSDEQFMSTLHASHDNGIAFGELKDRVTAGQSLGMAMHSLKPSMDSNASAAAATQAEARAKDDKVSASGSASASASVTATR